VELYGRVRHAVLVDGMSRREAARIFGINRRTVEKMLRFSIPPDYRRDKAIRRPRNSDTRRSGYLSGCVMNIALLGASRL
jgi:transposase